MGNKEQAIAAIHGLQLKGADNGRRLDVRFSERNHREPKHYVNPCSNPATELPDLYKCSPSFITRTDTFITELLP